MKKIIAGVIVIILIIVGISYFNKNSKQTAVTEPIKIGVILPLSGDAAFLGESARNAAILAKENFKNTKNEYELIFEDDQADSKKTVSAFRKLVDLDKVKATIAVFSGPANAIAPLGEKEKVIVFTIASDTTIAKNKPFVFNHWIKPENEAKAYVEYAKRQGLKRIAMIAVNQQGVVAVRDALLKEDPSIFILKDELFSQQEKDFRTLILKAKANNADSFILKVLPGQLVPLIKQIKELGMNVPLTSIESFEEEKEAIPLLEGQWYVTSANPTGKFIEDFKIEYNSLPQVGSGNAYDIISLLITAFEKSNGNTEITAKNLSLINNFHGALGILSVDNDGNINSDAAVKKIINGKFVEIK